MIKKIQLILVWIISLLISKNAVAIAHPDYTPLIPISYQLCPTNYVPVLQRTWEYVEFADRLQNDLTKYTDVTALKQTFNSYLSTMGNTFLNSLMQKAAQRNKVVSYSRTIKESKIADVNSEQSVKSAYVKLFLQYPSNKNSIKTAYRDKGEQLKIDTVLEMFVTSSEMSKELYGDDSLYKTINSAETNVDIEKIGMIGQLAELEKCLLGDKEQNKDICSKLGIKTCEGENEDNMCFWNSAVQVAKMYDKFMRYNEYLIAMQAQYQAVKAIETLARIKDYEKPVKKSLKDMTKIEKTSDNHSVPVSQLYASDSIGTEVAFAAESYEERNLAEEIDAYTNDLQSKTIVVDGVFDKLDKATGFTDALDGTEEAFENLTVIADIEENLDKSKEFHNAKQHMPKYRSIFKKYQEIKDYHTKTVENLKISGECAQNFLDAYYVDASKAWLGDSCRYHDDSENMYCHYEPDREASNEENSAGLYDILCPDNTDYKCYVISVAKNKYTSGISGYLYNLYQTAKIQDALAENDAYIDVLEDEKETDKYAGKAPVMVKNDKSADVLAEENEYMVIKDSDTSGNVGMSLAQNNALNKESDVSSASALQSSVRNHKKADELEEETRKQSLMNWVLGREVTKEVLTDVNTQKSKFGKLKKATRLWNDQKEFYNQYIDFKYDSISKYIQYVPLDSYLTDIAKAIHAIYPYSTSVNAAGVAISAVSQQKTTVNAINSILSNAKSAVNPYADIEAKINKTDIELATLEKKHRQELRSLVNHKETLLKDLDAAKGKLSDMNKQYNDSNETIAVSNINTPFLEEAQNKFSIFYKDRSKVDIFKSPQFAGSSDSLVKGFTDTKRTLNNNKISALTAKRKSSLTTELENSIKQIQKDLDNTDKKIETERANFVRKYSNAEENARQERAELVKKGYTWPMQTVISKATSASPVVGLANNLLTCVRKYALQKVDEAKAQITKLKTNDELYYASNYRKLNNIHRDMISKITSISADDLSKVEGCEVLTMLNKFGGLVDSVLQPAFKSMRDICSGNSCTQEDRSYFVSILGQKEDFTAPKAPLSFSNGDLREVFHFDMIDYENVDKYVADEKKLYSNETVTITAKSFLDSGIEIPELWKYILARHTYGQRDIDLSKLLSNTQEKSFIRSGIFPCHIENKVIDVTWNNKHNFSYIINKPADYAAYANVPECQSITLKGGKVIDKETDGGRNGGTPLDGNIANSSELGTILAYIPEPDDIIVQKLKTNGLPLNLLNVRHKLTFNPALQRVVYNLSQTSQLGKNADTDADFYFGQRALLTRNQFGDYLDFVEHEAVAAEALEKLDNRIGAIYKNFYEVFYATDYVFSEDFSLLNDDDYNEVSKVLDEHKSIYLNMAKKKLAEIKITSLGISDKLKDLRKKIAILEKDNEEVVSISGNEDIDELDEIIKRRKADAAVEHEYSEASAKASEDHLKRLQSPYCSVYLSGVGLKNSDIQHIGKTTHIPLVEEILQKLNLSTEAKEAKDLKDATQVK